MNSKQVTSIHEPIIHEESPKLKTNHEKSQCNIPELSTNNRQLDNFQKQVEQTVTRRFELFCNLYLEQITFWGNVTGVSTSFPQKILAKWGLKIDSQPEFQNMVDEWSNVVRSGYSNQNIYLETVLNMMHQNMRMINMNMNGFTKIIWSNYSWGIPPNLESSTTS
jgi:hypothetical protein